MLKIKVTILLILFILTVCANAADNTTKLVLSMQPNTLVPKAKLMDGSNSVGLDHGIKFKSNYQIIIKDLNTIAYSVTTEIKSINFPYKPTPTFPQLKKENIPDNNVNTAEFKDLMDKYNALKKSYIALNDIRP